MTSTTMTNKQYRLANRPEGKVDDTTFELVEENVPTLKDGEFILKNLYLSIDPTNRIWVSDMEQYMPPVQIGEVMRGLGVGRVIESKNDKFPVGHLVSGPIGWQEFTLGSEAVDWPFSSIGKESPVPLTALVGAVGMTGLTAYFGLNDVAKAKSGETVLISGAAGAVGSVAGQIAKIIGCRVVGIAGSDEKCNWIKQDLGFDEAINYKKSDWKEQLAAATPDGIDVNFENVGGPIMNEVFTRLNQNARVALCGLISSYNDAGDENTRVSLGRVLMKRIMIKGFIVTDFFDQFADASVQLGKWMYEGKLKSKETVLEGLSNAPVALNYLFEGKNIGKQLVKIASD